MVSMQESKDKKRYTLENLKPYPYDKYKGQGDPRDHIRELFTSCIEVAHEDTYLLRIFPKSLGGPTLEWFSHLPPKITSWGELLELFILNFSHNIGYPVSLIDLCTTKQKEIDFFYVLAKMEVIV